jgi:tRNA nucleotidyltransferase/poly(A) polymerase
MGKHNSQKKKASARKADVEPISKALLGSVELDLAVQQAFSAVGIHSAGHQLVIDSNQVYQRLFTDWFEAVETVDIYEQQCKLEKFKALHGNILNEVDQAFETEIVKRLYERLRSLESSDNFESTQKKIQLIGYFILQHLSYIDIQHRLPLIQIFAGHLQKFTFIVALNMETISEVSSKHDWLSISHSLPEYVKYFESFVEEQIKCFEYASNPSTAITKPIALLVSQSPNFAVRMIDAASQLLRVSVALGDRDNAVKLKTSARLASDWLQQRIMNSSNEAEIQMLASMLQGSDIAISQMETSIEQIEKRSNVNYTHAIEQLSALSIKIHHDYDNISEGNLSISGISEVLNDLIAKFKTNPESPSDELLARSIEVLNVLAVMPISEEERNLFLTFWLQWVKYFPVTGNDATIQSHCLKALWVSVGKEIGRIHQLRINEERTKIDALCEAWFCAAENLDLTEREQALLNFYDAHQASLLNPSSDLLIKISTVAQKRLKLLKAENTQASLQKWAGLFVALHLDYLGAKNEAIQSAAIECVLDGLEAFMNMFHQRINKQEGVELQPLHCLSILNNLEFYNVSLIQKFITYRFNMVKRAWNENLNLQNQESIQFWDMVRSNSVYCLSEAIQIGTNFALLLGYLGCIQSAKAMQQYLDNVHAIISDKSFMCTQLIGDVRNTFLLALNRERQGLVNTIEHTEKQEAKYIPYLHQLNLAISTESTDSVRALSDFPLLNKSMEPYESFLNELKQAFIGIDERQAQYLMHSIQVFRDSVELNPQIKSIAKQCVSQLLSFIEVAYQKKISTLHEDRVSEGTSECSEESSINLQFFEAPIFDEIFSQPYGDLEFWMDMPWIAESNSVSSSAYVETEGSTHAQKIMEMLSRMPNEYDDGSIRVMPKLDMIDVEERSDQPTEPKEPKQLTVKQLKRIIARDAKVAAKVERARQAEEAKRLREEEQLREAIEAKQKEVVEPQQSESSKEKENLPKPPKLEVNKKRKKKNRAHANRMKSRLRQKDQELELIVEKKEEPESKNEGRIAPVPISISIQGASSLPKDNVWEIRRKKAAEEQMRRDSEIEEARREAEERARREAEERARREAEERARREAEEQARREAEERARREAEEQARSEAEEQVRKEAEALVLLEQQLAACQIISDGEKDVLYLVPGFPIQLKDTFLEESSNILLRINQLGHRAYYVGGVVRDIVTDQGFSRDVDIIAECSERELQEILGFPILRNQNISEANVYRYGKYDIVLKDKGFCLQQDAMMRDFEPNGLYMDSTGRILDPLGVFDRVVTKQPINTIGLDPISKLEADPIRILRAIDLSTKMNQPLRPELEEAISIAAQGLRNIPYGALKFHLNKMFSNGHAVSNFSLFQKFNLLPYLFPRLGSEFQNYFVRHKSLPNFIRYQLRRCDEAFNPQHKVNCDGEVYSALFLFPGIVKTKELYGTTLEKSIEDNLRYMKLDAAKTRIPEYIATFMEQYCSYQSFKAEPKQKSNKKYNVVGTTLYSSSSFIPMYSASRRSSASSSALSSQDERVQFAENRPGSSPV